MKNSKKSLFTVLLILPLILVWCAAQAQQPVDAGFAVRPVLTANQVDPSVGYYYLDTKPGQKQMLEMIVINRGDAPIEVLLEANTAFSNSNGVIEYTPTEERDPSLAIDFAAQMTIPEPVLTVPALGEATAQFILEMPEEALAGEMLGGIVVKKLPTENEPLEQTQGLAISNIFVYTVAVRIRQDDAVIAPAFEATAARMGELAGYPTLLLDIRNPQPLVVKGLALDVQVFGEEDDAPVLQFASENRSMAPNSLMPFQHVFYDGETLGAGTYRVEARLSYREATWSFSLPLTVPGA